MTNYELGKNEYNNKNYEMALAYYEKDFGYDPLCTYGIFVLIQIGFVKNLYLIKKVNEKFINDILKIIEISNKDIDYNAIYIAGVCSERGIVVERNLEDAIKYYDKCYKHGNLDAGFNMACIYQSNSNISMAVEIYEDLVEKKHIEAIVNLGYIRLNDSKYRDIDKALCLFELGVQLNNDLSKYYLSLMLLNKNKSEYKNRIIDLLTESSNTGNFLASTFLSKLYLFDDLFLNQRLGFKLLEKQIKTNYPEVVYLYAKCLDEGLGTEKNTMKADLFYTKAQRLGYKI